MLVTIVENEEGRSEEFFFLSKNNFCKATDMGGPRKQMEPYKYDVLRKNAKLWSMFERACFTPYFIAMEGYNVKLSYKFANAWKDDEVEMGGLHFKVDVKLITKATSLAYEEKKVAKISNGKYQDYILIFFEDKEKVEHFQNGYSMVLLPPPYHNVCFFVMRYFTLEGCSQSVHGYHFPILNHIRHLEKINLSLFLFSSLIQSLAHGENLSLHQGLI